MNPGIPNLVNMVISGPALKQRASSSLAWKICAVSMKGCGYVNRKVVSSLGFLGHRIFNNFRFLFLDYCNEHTTPQYSKSGIRR